LVERLGAQMRLTPLDLAAASFLARIECGVCRLPSSAGKFVHRFQRCSDETPYETRSFPPRSPSDIHEHHSTSVSSRCVFAGRSGLAFPALHVSGAASPNVRHFGADVCLFIVAVASFGLPASLLIREHGRARIIVRFRCHQMSPECRCALSFRQTWADP